MSIIDIGDFDYIRTNPIKTMLSTIKNYFYAVDNRITTFTS